MLILSIMLAFILLLIIGGLIVKSYPILKENSFWSLVTSSDWHPLKGKFGMLPFIMGTLWVTGLSIIHDPPGSVEHKIAA